MTWLIPTALLPIAGVIALVAVWPRLRQPTSNSRLVAEAFVVTLFTVTACAAAWAIYWWIEQRW